MKEHVANILKQMGEYDMTRRQNRGRKKQKKKKNHMLWLVHLFYFFSFSFCFDKHLSFLTYDVKIIVNQGEVD